jgi:hypothetical protein
VFLQVQTGPATTDQAVPPALVCVLPRDAAAEQVFEINLPGLELRTDQLVGFQACSSTRHGSCDAGDVLPWDADAYHMLPPLQTIIRTAREADAGRTRPCRSVWQRSWNVLGLLQISCVGPTRERRSPGRSSSIYARTSGSAATRHAASPPVAPNATSEAQRAARDHIATIFTRPHKVRPADRQCHPEAPERITVCPA